MIDPPESDALLRVAGAVADGEPVDWEGEQPDDSTDQTTRRRLGRLRELQVMRQAHESLDGTSQDETGSTLSEQETTDVRSPASQQPYGPLPAWGALRVLDKIGVGGFAEVYRAYDPALQKTVALKLPRPDRAPDELASQRFLDEARRLARVRHENVLAVHGADRHDGRIGLWTDLLLGRTLEALLEERGNLGAGEAGQVGVDLCRALAAVHGAGLIHRDVKTANVMREDGGRIVLMDFSAVAERLPGEDIAQDTSASGTPNFMAPELFKGGGASTASDIYSLGVVLYRLVTGTFPVPARNLGELRDKHLARDSVPLLDIRPDLPATFVRVVERALEIEPARRYRSAGEMEKELSTAIGRIGTDTTHDTPPRKDTNHGLAWGLVSAAILAVAAGLAWQAGLFSGSAQDTAAPRTMPATSALGVETSLFRRGAETDDRLRSGTTIQPGDDLFLEISAEEPMYVYVLDEDEAGTTAVLFPLPGLDLQNPLAAGTLHRLPGVMEGRERFWQVTSSGGEESILIIAARQRLEDLEEQLESVPRAGDGVPFQLARENILPTLRGIGGLSTGEVVDAESMTTTLDSIFTELSTAATATSGVRFWRFRLLNPVAAPPDVP